MANSTELLTERETTVLKTVLVHYITTGEPVGSRTVAKFSGLSLSSASIRNIMLDLEESGYLRQPHTSAGRLPTPLRFRYYVGHFLPVQELTVNTQRQIQEAFRPAATDPQDLFRQASRALSGLTGHPALVLTPRPQAMCLKHIQFISVGGDMDRNHRCPGCQCALHLAVDVPKLRIAVRMIAALFDFPVALQAKALCMKQLADLHIADRVTLPCQFERQNPRAPHRPSQGRFRITERVGFDELFQAIQ